MMDTFTPERRLNNAGFSLTELVISIGVTAILMIALAHFTAVSYRSAAVMEKSLEIEDQVEDVKLTLQSARECTLNLGNLPYSASMAAGASVLSLSAHDQGSPPAPAQNLVRVGEMHEGVRLLEMRLVPLEEIDRGIIVSSLRFRFEKVGDPSVAARVREIPLVVRTQAGRVRECWARGQRVRVAQDRVCELTSGGLTDTFDETTGTCISGRTRWIRGTPTLAQCPTGYQIRMSANASDDCGVELPAGFVDPFAPVIRDFNGNIIPNMRPRPPAVLRLNAAARSCTCAYGNDLAPSVSASSTCLIRCLEI